MNARSYREHLAAGGVDGIPKGSLYAANLLTDAGVQGSAKRYQNRQAFDEGRAAYAVNMSLAQSASRTLKARNNPYSRILAKQYYGMGDDTPDFDPVTAGAAFTPDYTAPPVTSESPISMQTGPGTTYYSAPSLPIAAPSPGGSSSQWSSVLNSSSVANLFSGVGTGLSRLIGGQAVPSSSILPSSLTSGSPSLGTMMLIGAGAIGAAYFLFRKKRA
jgi:hypothetical protein